MNIDEFLWKTYLAFRWKIFEVIVINYIRMIVKSRFKITPKKSNEVIATRHVDKIDICSA